MVARRKEKDQFKDSLLFNEHHKNVGFYEICDEHGPN